MRQLPSSDSRPPHDAYFAPPAVLTVPEVLGPLVDLLQTGDPDIQEQAAWALGNVSSNATSKMAIINLGALGALRALNEHRNTPPDVQVRDCPPTRPPFDAVTASARLRPRSLVSAGRVEQGAAVALPGADADLAQDLPSAANWTRGADQVAEKGCQATQPAEPRRVRWERHPV